MPVTEFTWAARGAEVSWKCGDIRVQRKYSADIVAIPLRDGSGVAVVEPEATAGPLNAVIFNCDGSERVRLVPPRPTDGNGFYDMYYVNGVLTGIVGIQGGDFALEIDEKSGQILRKYETR